MRRAILAALLAVALVAIAGCSTTVPDLTGMELREATDAIYGAGLNLGVITEEYDAGVAEGLVISQNPKAGTELAGSILVDLVLSKGPGDASAADDTEVPDEDVEPDDATEDDEAQPRMVVVPSWTEFRGTYEVDQLGELKASIEAGFAAQGLVAVVEYAPWQEGDEGGQVPPAGESVPAGTEVAIRILVAD